MVAEVTQNGQATSSREDFAEKLTGEPLTEGYRPTLPLWAMYTIDTIPQLYLMRDIELMVIHPVVRSALEFYKAGVAGAEFWGGPKPDDPEDEQGVPISDNPEVSTFVHEHCQRWWDRAVPKLQGGYEYGWIAGEPTYAAEGGRLYWDDLIQFSPRDVFLLTRGAQPVGVRVKQVRQAPDGQSNAVGGSGQVDLWTASRDIPAKGVWYAHNPRYSAFYGQSQLLGAWRPWRRLAWRDGAESNMDLGVYRHLVPATVCKYPNEDLQTGVNAPGIATTVDSQGRPRRFSRDTARQIAEWLKSGASVGLPSENYPAELGGGPKWGLDQFAVDIKIADGIAYIKHLWDQIRYGIGVPPELESSESAGGYSGRSIPLYSFLEQQQRLADAFLVLFIREILAPLVRWNFGDVQWKVQVKPLLKTRFKMQKGEASQPTNPIPPQNAASPLPGQREGGRAFPAPAGPTPPDGVLPSPGGFSVGGPDIRSIVDKILAAGMAA